MYRKMEFPIVLATRVLAPGVLAPGVLAPGVLGRGLLAATAGAALLGLSACDQIDPLQREGLWHPMHVNRADLTMQASNPADLVRGNGVHTSDGVLDAAAIQRLHEGKVKKLLDAGTSDIAPQSQGGGGN